MTTPVLTPRAARELDAFRLLLDGMARPGTIATAALHFEAGDMSAPVALLEALLDHEVAFAFVPRHAAAEEAVLRLTGSRIASPESADFIVASGDGIPVAIRGARPGEFEYPDRSATVIALVQSVGKGGDGETLVLSGPGIQGRCILRVEGPIDGLLAAREEANADLPQGVDVILIDPSGRTACIPRYAVVSKGAS